MTEREALNLALEFITASNQRSEFWLVPSSNLNKTVTAIREALAQPEQEPVAWLHTKIEGVAVPHRPADLDKHPDRWEALYKTPPPCPTCEALARTVMLDQTSHDTTPPQPEQTVHREMQPIQKPICWANINKQGDVTHTQNKRGSWAKTPLYTSPPNYKPLTSEEYSILAEKYTGADGLDCVDYGRAIARHYGIKE